MQRNKKHCSKIFHIFFLSFLLILSAINIFPINSVSADPQVVYYVSNSGDDSDTGLSPDNAWQTIGKVNLELNNGCINDGDDIYFKCGDVFDDSSLNIRTGGLSDNAMIVGSYGSGKKPIFNDTGSCTIQINEDNLENIQIENLILQNSTSTSVLINSNLRNITLQNLTVRDSGQNGIFVDQTIGLIIENCVVYNCDQSNIVLYGDPTERLSYTKVLNCTSFSSGAGDCIMIHKDDSNNNAGFNHLIRNCTTYNSGEDGIDITAGTNVIVEDCETYGNSNAGIVVGHDINNVTIQNNYIHDEDVCGLYVTDGCNFVVRNNIVYDSVNSPLHLYPSTGAGYAGEDGYMENCTIYNNVFVLPNGYSGTNRVVGITYDYYHQNYLKNNIFATFDSSSPDRLLRVFSAVIPPSDDVIFDTNMWYHGSGSSTNKWWNGSNLMSLSKWNDFYENDLFSNPDLADVSTGNFSLLSYSPCIDNGSWLTQTNGGGTGTTIAVDDVSYFSDGYSINSGDCIFVGDDVNLEIISIDYELNKLTIDQSISWEDNDNVSLYPFYGSKVDIGAIEYGSSDISSPVISNVTALPNTQTTGGNINISCSVTSELALSEIHVNISNPSGETQNISMDGMNVYFYNTSYTVCGTYDYFIWASDVNNNHAISTECSFIIEEVNESTTPNIEVVSNYSSNPIDTNPSYGWINFSCQITDDDLDSVYLNYTYGNGISTNSTMIKGTGNWYYLNTSLSLYGCYSYFVWCNDTEGNCNSSDSVDYWLPPNWDVNNDGLISVLDLNLVSNKYNQLGDGGWIREDVDNNGKINILDLVTITNYMGESWK